MICVIILSEHHAYQTNACMVTGNVYSAEVGNASLLDTSIELVPCEVAWSISMQYMIAE